jgi:GSH-dependent disulfide-bond oxidoreductase
METLNVAQNVIELHGAETGNCVRVSIAFEEAELPYRVKLLNLREGEHRGVEHLALNPAGKVPTIIDRSRGDRAIVLSQSNAIILYAADLAPGRLIPTDDDASRARTFERFFYFLTDVIAPSHAAFSLPRSGSRDAARLLKDRSVMALASAESFLEGSRYIAGENFTVADIAAFTITLADDGHLDWDRLPRLRRWFDEVSERPSVQRGLHAFDI